MHPEFPDWYRIVDPSLDSETLERRWQGVEAFCKTLDVDRTIKLVLVNYRSAVSESFSDEFFDVFRSTDSTLPRRGSSELLAVLAGACLAHLITKGGDIAVVAALSTITEGYMDAKQGAIPDLLISSKEYLASRSLTRFDRSQQKTINKIPFNSDEVNAKLVELCRPDAQITGLADFLHGWLKGLNSITSRLATSATVTKNQQRLQQEELDVLWWVFGEYSRDLDVPFADIPIAERTVLAAKELVDLVYVAPGPYSVKAFLRKVLSFGGADYSKTITVYDAVNASDVQWRRKWSESHADHYPDEICPIAFSVRRSLESSNKSHWLPAFKSLTGHGAKQRVKPIELAMHTYYEALLLKMISDTADDQ